MSAVTPRDEQRLLALLSDEERERRSRFRFEEHRKENLVTRALVRTALGARLGVAPEALRFTRTAHGRPELASPASDLVFNLANTTELVVLAIAESTAERRVELGVDLEGFARAEEIFEVAERVFTPAERDALDALPLGGPREERAVRSWTVKEAYVKARGDGLSLPLQGFGLAWRAGAPSLILEAPIDPDPRWTFLVATREGHAVAAACRITVPARLDRPAQPTNAPTLVSFREVTL